MRTYGTLIKWNDDRGFGFIAPAQGVAAIFVHISEFPRDGQRPRINELISFETTTGQNGKLRAVRVMRPGQSSALHRPGTIRHSGQSAASAGGAFALLAVVAIGIYGYSRFSRSVPETPLTPIAAIAPAPLTTFECDGRTMCSQMHSCEEAEYFLKHCPNTQMDGDNDGEPCEQQWCN